MVRQAPRSILITGGSSGLGAALAASYAAPGVTLALTGRDPARLAAVTALCRERGATVHDATHDVTQPGPIGAWAQAMDDAAPIDLAIAAAGISGGPQPGQVTEGLASAAGQVAANLLGAMHVIEPLLGRMVARRSGHIAVVSSVAGYRGLPIAPATAPAEAGVRAYGDGLRAALAPHGVFCSVVVPVSSTPHDGSLHGRQTLPHAAGTRRLAHPQGLDRRRARIVFPRLLGLGIQATDLMPPFLGDRILRSVRFHIRPRT